MANLVLPLALALLCAAAAGASSGCPACGADLAGHKIATVHPGEPAMMLFGIPTAEQCAQECKNNSPELLFFQHAKSTLQGEYTCLCLATCYSVYEADESEGAVSGSLCRDLPCPTTCSNAPASNMVYLGNPANVVYQGFAWAPMNATNGTAWSNFTMISPNGTFPANYTGNSTAGNSTVAAAFGMSFEECRSHAAAQINPPTPYFSHLEAMSTCLLFDKCAGMAPAGTGTAQSGAFCLPSLLRGNAKKSKASATI